MRSSDPDGTIVAYRWDVGADQVLDAETVTVTLNEPGERVIVLTVTDDDGATASTQITLTATAPPPPEASTMLETPEAAARFLNRSGLGGTKAEIDALVGTDAADWVRAQLDMPYTPTLPEHVRLSTDFKGEGRGEAHYQLTDRLLSSDDVLRQRMIFALSQIFVINDANAERWSTTAFLDVLGENAFGTYETLITDVTYSPAMSYYLTYFQVEKGDPETGRAPDENYARELMQLFSIGLVELNMDGTPKRGADGEEVPTYGPDDVAGLARVFTGFNQNGRGEWRPGNRSLRQRLNTEPLEIDASRHSAREKRFLGHTIPQNTSGPESVRRAMARISEHPNVAPFISRQLIQRFAASHPAPDYVERVANAFRSGRFTAPGGQVFGRGQRGDLEAALAAVLLDPSLFDGVDEPTEGKIREPFLQLATWAHGVNVDNPGTYHEPLLYRSDGGRSIGQFPFKSPSVFNFYRPGYVAEHGETSDADLTAPELQIVTGQSRARFVGAMAAFIFDTSLVVRGPSSETMAADETELEAAAASDETLIEHLDTYWCSGRMSETTRDVLNDVLAALPVGDTERRTERVRYASLATVTAPCFEQIN